MTGSRPKRAAILGLGLTAILAGCARPDPIELPELSLVDLRLSSVRVFETTADFEIRITNPTPQPLSLEGGTVHVYLEGLSVGKGLIAGPVEIPRFDSATVRLPVYINNLAVATRLRPILTNERLAYRIKGVLYTTGAGKIRTSQEGEFDFRPQELPLSLDPAGGG